MFDARKRVIVFVLGASDPEMDLIERILRSLGYTVIYACFGIERVQPNTAYQATFPIVQSNQVWIECEPSSGFGNTQAVLIDHHKKGDPGYDCPPELYLEGSSIGQVHNFLQIEPNQDVLVAAAADHCLFEAYQGDCPGVHPLEVWEWQITQTAFRHNLDRKMVENQLSEYEVLLASMNPTQFEPGFEAYIFPRPFEEFWRFLCWRDLCFSERVAYIISIRILDENGDRFKIGISGNVTPEFIRGFLTGTYFPSFSGERVGCPVRRYAWLLHKWIVDI